MAELDDAQSAEMADRLRRARARGVGDEKLRDVAAKGLRRGDPPRARRAADIWLTFRVCDEPAGPPAA
jgi:hypothetical protein